MLIAKNVCIQRQQKIVLTIDDVTLSPGEVVTLLGPNGAGKSTLLHVLSGELQSLSGTVLINGRTRHEWTRTQLAQTLVVLPQVSQIHFPLSVLEVVLLGRTPHGTTQADNVDIAQQCLLQVDMGHMAECWYSQLSGGEQQRVQLARILAQLFNKDISRTRFVLLDEPTCALDLAHQHLMMHLLQELAQQNIGILVTLHDLNLAMQYADRVMLLKQGVQMANGIPGKMLSATVIQAVFNLQVVIIDHPRLIDKKVIIPA